MKIQNINLRTSLVPITSLNLNKASQETLLTELAQLKSTAPDLFKGLPCILGMKHAELTSNSLERLVESIRAMGLAPIGLKDAGEDQLASLPSLGLADFGPSKASSASKHSTEQPSVNGNHSKQAEGTETSSQSNEKLEKASSTLASRPNPADKSATDVQLPESEVDLESEKKSAPPEPNEAMSDNDSGQTPEVHSENTPTDAPNINPKPEVKALQVLSENVRSGQQIHFDGDLVIQGMVSAGAEVLATGNIQIMGALRGKALAGLRGDEQAYVSCAQFYAEMVSIAGQYQLFDDAKYQGQPVVIRLQSDKIVRIGPNS